jgi:hypothetical protein
MPTLAAVEQYLYRDDGIVLGSDATLPFVDILNVQGLDSAETRATVKDHEGTDGGFVESKYDKLRTVVISAVAYTSPTAYEAYMDQLKANFASDDTVNPFYFQTDAGQRVVFGKSQGLKYEKTNERNYGKQQFSVTLLCPDSRIYSPDAVTSGPIYLGSATVAGRGYPKGYPFGYGIAATQSAGSITPGGNRDTPGWMVITGPIINPVVVNDTTGQQEVFTTSLAALETLWINPRVRTVRLGQGGPSRRNTMRGPWWYLKKDQNNFRLLGSGGTAGVTKLEVFARPAWR